MNEAVKISAELHKEEMSRFRSNFKGFDHAVEEVKAECEGIR